MQKSFWWSSIGVILALSLFGPAALGCPVGDLDKNCKIDIGDFQVFAENWLEDGVCTDSDCPNLDGTGAVTMSDFARLAEHWGENHSELVISEFMAINDEAHPDEEGKFPDWIEIY
ncbi:MAG TPA: hypothetical protein VJJ98_10430, partial [Sedimentisphaerales bacterium]|nr:hypothetical protein [Sedimentisphaerales bacterium]